MSYSRYVSATWRTWVPLVLKIATAVLLAGALYYQLFVAHSFGELYAEFLARLAVAPAWMPIAIAALVPLNIGLEAYKFARLLPPSRRPTLWEATARVCAGLTVGLFTPNRVGEYLGRLTYAYPGERAATVVATLLGGAAQWLPLLWGGAAAALCWPLLTEAGAPIESLRVATAGILGLLLLAGFFRLRPLVTQLGRALGWITRRLPSPRLREQLEVVRTRILSLGHAAAARPRDLRLAFAISGFRYAVYLTQLALAFGYFGLSAPPTVAVAGTAAILLAQTFIPLPAVLQALARIELARLLWGGYAPNEVGLATASVLIFVLNLGLPALVGLVVIARSDVAKTFGPDPLREPQRSGAGARAGVVRSVVERR